MDRELSALVFVCWLLMLEGPDILVALELLGTDLLDADPLGIELAALELLGMELGPLEALGIELLALELLGMELDALELLGLELGAREPLGTEPGIELAAPEPLGAFEPPAMDPFRDLDDDLDSERDGRFEAAAFDTVEAGDKVQ